MLSLARDPMDRGEELWRHGGVCWRMLGVGALGLILFDIDDTAKRVFVVDVMWHAKP